MDVLTIFFQSVSIDNLYAYFSFISALKISVYRYIYVQIVTILFPFVLYWIKEVRAGIFVLFLNLKKKLSVFHYWILLKLWACHIWHYYIEVCFLYTRFASFYCEWMLNFVRCFFCVHWDDHVIFMLFFKCDVSHWFEDAKPIMHPWNKSHLIMVYGSFNAMLKFSLLYFVEDFYIYIH